MRIYLNLGFKELFLEIEVRRIGILEYEFHSRRQGDYLAFVPLTMSNRLNQCGLGLLCWVSWV